MPRNKDHSSASEDAEFGPNENSIEAIRTIELENCSSEILPNRKHFLVTATLFRVLPKSFQNITKSNAQCDAGNELVLY